MNDTVSKLISDTEANARVNDRGVTSNTKAERLHIERMLQTIDTGNNKTYPYSYTTLRQGFHTHSFLSFESLVKREARDAYINGVHSFIVDRKPWRNLDYIPPIVIVKKTFFSSTSFHLTEITEDTYKYVSKKHLASLGKLSLLSSSDCGSFESE